MSVATRQTADICRSNIILSIVTYLFIAYLSGCNAINISNAKLSFAREEINALCNDKHHFCWNDFKKTVVEDHVLWKLERTDEFDDDGNVTQSSYHWIINDTNLHVLEERRDGGELKMFLVFHRDSIKNKSAWLLHYNGVTKHRYDMAFAGMYGLRITVYKDETYLSLASVDTGEPLLVLSITNGRIEVADINGWKKVYKDYVDQCKIHFSELGIEPNYSETFLRRLKFLEID